MLGPQHKCPVQSQISRSKQEFLPVSHTSRLCSKAAEGVGEGTRCEEDAGVTSLPRLSDQQIHVVMQFTRYRLKLVGGQDGGVKVMFVKRNVSKADISKI